MDQINKLLSLRKSQGFSNQIILADFNTEMKNIVPLIGNVKDTVDLTKGAQAPSFTHWRGKTIDFAMVSEDLAKNSKFHNSGSISSDASDHLAVFADITPGSLSIVPTSSLNSASGLFPEPHSERAKAAVAVIAATVGGIAAARMANNRLENANAM
jgi:hypothetical protein